MTYSKSYLRLPNWTLRNRKVKQDEETGSCTTSLNIIWRHVITSTFQYPTTTALISVPLVLQAIKKTTKLISVVGFPAICNPIRTTQSPRVQSHPIRSRTCHNNSRPTWFGGHTVGLRKERSPPSVFISSPYIQRYVAFSLCDLAGEPSLFSSTKLTTGNRCDVVVLWSKLVISFSGPAKVDSTSSEEAYDIVFGSTTIKAAGVLKQPNMLAWQSLPSIPGTLSVLHLSAIQGVRTKHERSALCLSFSDLCNVGPDYLSSQSRVL